MTKTKSSLLCGLALLSAGFISICSGTEPTKALQDATPHNAAKTNTTPVSSSLFNVSRAGLNSQDINAKSNLEFKVANQLLSSQNNRYLHSPTSLKTKLAGTRRQGITVSVNTLMKPTNLPGRYLGKSKVMLVHY